MLWGGGTFIAGRVLAAEVSPLPAAFVRFALAGAVLVVLARQEKGAFPRDRHTLGILLLLGTTGVAGYNLLFFTGLRTVEAGRAALIIANNPVAIAAGAALVLGERLAPSLWLGAGLVGAVIALTRSRAGAPSLRTGSS